MSQFQPLPDPTNLQATIAPIDTYFRPAERNVAGAPVGPNPAREIAAAMGRFDQSLQQYYFQPAHEEMKQQQQADAQIYHDRLKNFKSFDEAVKNGTIHQGDNPWLQAFTKELFAKDAANDLSIRAAEFTDRQDILRGEYNGKKYQSADQAFAAAFADVSADVLESHGGMGDAYFRSVYSQMSGPIRDRAANQFAQGLRRHNIETAMTALEKDINNNLTDMLAGFAGADGEAKGQMVQQFAAATKALAVESNLLTKQQVNSVVGRAVLGYVESLSEDHPRTAATLLDMFDDIETSPGSFLRDSTAFNLQVTRLEEKIGDNLVKESDDEYQRERIERQRAAWESSSELNKLFYSIEDLDNVEKNPEVQEKRKAFIDKYAGLVDNPAAVFDARLSAIKNKSKQETTDEGVEEGEDVLRQLRRGEITPQAARDAANSDALRIPPGLAREIHNVADVVQSKGELLSRGTYDHSISVAGTRSKELFDLTSVEVLDSNGFTKKVEGPGRKHLKEVIDHDVRVALFKLEASDEWKALSNDPSARRVLVEDTVNAIYDSNLNSYKEELDAINEVQQSTSSPSSVVRTIINDKYAGSGALSVLSKKDEIKALEAALGDEPLDPKNRPAWVAKNTELKTKKDDLAEQEKKLQSLLSVSNPVLRELPKGPVPKEYKHTKLGAFTRNMLRPFYSAGDDHDWLARWATMTPRERWLAHRSSERKAFRTELSAASLVDRKGEVFRKVAAIVRDPRIPESLARDVIDLDYLVVFTNEDSLDKHIEDYKSGSPAAFLSQFFDVMGLDESKQKAWLDNQRESLQIKEGKLK